MSTSGVRQGGAPADLGLRKAADRVWDRRDDPSGIGRSRLLTGLAGLVGLTTLPCVLAAPAAAAGAAPAGQATRSRPDIVVVLTDDQRLDDLGVMTTVQRDLAGHGTTFTNAIVVNAVCCPSRATLLTGRQSHGSGVFTNGADCHGARPFDDSSTVATTLDAAGYRTGLVGKYRNSWTGASVPPGWDDVHAFWGVGDNSGGAYYDYQLSHNGTLQSYGGSAADYSTDVLAPFAERFIRDTPASQSLFLLFTPFGPHGGQKPAPRHLGRFSSMAIPHGPDFNEADVSDKPAYIQSLPRLTAAAASSVDNERRRARETLLSVDEAVGGIMAALRDTGRLSTTLILFSSDQGLARGEHRLARKGAPYDDILRVPMVVRYDAEGSAARTDDRLVSNIDIAPTAAALAGTRMPGADGRSLLPLLSGTAAPWRNAVLTEYVQGGDPIPSYCAVRTATRQYVRYVTGEVELYDLQRDPYEVANAAADPAYAADLAVLAPIAADQCSLTAWAPPASPGLPSRFVPGAPYRLFDSRAPGPLGVEKPYDGQTITVPVAGRGSPATPAAATAVAVNVTVTEAEGWGFLTAFPTGADVPLASTENFGAGTTAPNFTVVPLGAQGKVSLYVEGAPVHVIVDVAGYYLPATSASAGRLVALPPTRLLDTRTGLGAPAAMPGPDSTTRVQVLGRGGVPPAGVAAVAFVLTGLAGPAPGYVTAYPGGQPRPLASSLNLDHPWQVRANLAMVPVGADGTVNLYSSGGSHLLVDVAGYVTDTGAATAATGLFVPITPVRLRDTRVVAPVGPVAPGATLTVPVAAGGLPASASAVLVNVTGTAATAAGFVTVYPAGTPRPVASNLNLEWAGATVPCSAVVGVGTGGAIAAFSEQGTHLIVDAAGYYLA